MMDLSAFESLADVSRRVAREHGENTAQIFEDRVTSFQELDRRTSQIANNLIASGCEPQTRIGFLGKNSDRYFELILGTTKANCVLVGVNWRLAVPELAYIINDAQCSMLFVGAEYYDTARALCDQCPHIRSVVAMDGGHDEWPAFAVWRDTGSDVDPMLPIDLQDDVIQLYTSGTTGHPKGVQLTNQNYLAAFRAMTVGDWAKSAPGDVWLTCMPVFHVAGVNLGLIALAQGGTNVVMKEVDPEQILAFIPRYRVQFALFVPAVILFITQHPQAAGTDFSSLERVFYGASPIAEDLVLKAQAMFGCEMYQLYGLTETTGMATCLMSDMHDPARGKLRSCGKPYDDIALRVVDENGIEVPVGEVGEIVVQHGTVMKGYWNQPQATAVAIVDGWFRTGDAGYFDEDGFLYIYDRVKDMIVSGGENIYPAEIENALFSHPSVADVAVIGVPDDKWGEAVKAIVVVETGHKLAAEEIITHARSRIAGFKVPKSVDFVTTLPRNPSGKILRRELREPFWAGEKRRVN